MRRLIKYLFPILIFVAIGFVAYAIFGELPAPVRDTELTLPVPPAQG